MPCEARPNREQFARRAFARAPSAHPPTVARAPRTRNRAIVGVKTANAHALTRCDTMQTERPWSSCPRRFGHSGAAASRWGLCLFSRVRRRQHHPRAGFAEPSCRAARIEPEDHRPDPDPRKDMQPNAELVSCCVANCPSPPEPFGQRCGTSERPILDGGTDGSNPVPSSGESGANFSDDEELLVATLQFREQFPRGQDGDRLRDAVERVQAHHRRMLTNREARPL